MELQSRVFKPRGIYIKKDDLREENYGMTPGCRGCEAANRGISGVHNERCRLRIEKAIEEKEPERYTRVMTRLGVESLHEDKSEDKKRPSSEGEEDEGRKKEEKMRKVESSTSSSPEGQHVKQWVCPRCNQCNPAIYK